MWVYRSIHGASFGKTPVDGDDGSDGGDGDGGDSGCGGSVLRSQVINGLCREYRPRSNEALCDTFTLIRKQASFSFKKTLIDFDRF